MSKLSGSEAAMLYGQLQRERAERERRAFEALRQQTLHRTLLRRVEAALVLHPDEHCTTCNLPGPCPTRLTLQPR